MDVVVHIVTYNSACPALERTVRSVLEQEGLTSLRVEITDNASTDDTTSYLDEIYSQFPQVKVWKNRANLGFCGAHNQGIFRFLESSSTHYLALNPDAFLQSKTIRHLLSSFVSNPKVGAATPKLLRCNEHGEPSYPPVLDAAGMKLTTSLRHFDRGSGERDAGQFDKPELVFGGTGACLLLSKECIKDLLQPETDEEKRAVHSIFPQLASESHTRAPLFDEAFFAFREDADLGWRMQIRGWDCAYVPSAVAYHVRRVVPERRNKLSADINRHGVRNRFLLQLNNLPLRMPWRVFLHGVFLRNLVVILGVQFIERGSLPALQEVWILRKRALARRRRLVKHEHSSMKRGIKWVGM